MGGGWGVGGREGDEEPRQMVDALSKEERAEKRNSTPFENCSNDAFMSVVPSLPVTGNTRNIRAVNVRGMISRNIGCHSDNSIRSYARARATSFRFYILVACR